MINANIYFTNSYLWIAVEKTGFYEGVVNSTGAKTYLAKYLVNLSISYNLFRKLETFLVTTKRMNCEWLYKEPPAGALLSAFTEYSVHQIICSTWFKTDLSLRPGKLCQQRFLKNTSWLKSIKYKLSYTPATSRSLSAIQPHPQPKVTALSRSIGWPILAWMGTRSDTCE